MRQTKAERARHESSEELIHKAEFTVEEVAELYRISPDLVRHAIRNGHLPAQMAGHEIVSIGREDLIAWLATRSDD